MKFIELFALLLVSLAVPAQDHAPGAQPAPQRIQVPEAWAMGNLLEVVQPLYPEEASKQGIGGKVVLRVVIDSEGKVIEAAHLQGDPLFAKACLDVVTKWKFRPYIRDNQNVEVESTATIEFLAATSEVRTPRPYNGPVRLRVAQGVADKNAIKKTNPLYPAEALALRLEGDVILSAVIAKDGSIRDLKPIKGHPVLVAAAMKAVNEWKYKPYTLNGEPVEVETTIKISFHL